jgi:hypothetical protein
MLFTLYASIADKAARCSSADTQYRPSCSCKPESEDDDVDNDVVDEDDDEEEEFDEEEEAIYPELIDASVFFFFFFEGPAPEPLYSSFLLSAATNAADITVDLFRSSVAYRIASTIAVPADSTLVIISKDMGFYLEEGDALRVSGSAALRLQAFCSYEIIDDA